MLSIVKVDFLFSFVSFFLVRESLRREKIATWDPKNKPFTSRCVDSGLIIVFDFLLMRNQIPSSAKKLALHLSWPARGWRANSPNILRGQFFPEDGTNKNIPESAVWD